MIKVKYPNPELKQLLTTGRSSLYEAISRKKALVTWLRTFAGLLDVIGNTAELLKYRCMEYSNNGALSCVHVRNSQVEGTLFFMEDSGGKEITIQDLKIEQYGKLHTKKCV